MFLQNFRPQLRFRQLVSYVFFKNVLILYLLACGRSCFLYFAPQTKGSSHSHHFTVSLTNTDLHRFYIGSYIDHLYSRICFEHINFPHKPLSTPSIRNKNKFNHLLSTSTVCWMKMKTLEFFAYILCTIQLK